MAGAALLPGELFEECVVHRGINAESVQAHLGHRTQQLKDLSFVSHLAVGNEDNGCVSI